MVDKRLVINGIDFPRDCTAKYEIVLPENNRRFSKHQEIDAQYLTHENVRGIFLYHSVGSGKTRTALRAAELLKRKTLVILPATLKGSMINEYKRVYHHEMPSKQFGFASLNAGNTYEQIMTAAWELSGDTSTDERNASNALNGMFIIIDEVHVLVSRMMNTIKGKQIYELLFNAKNIKMMTMSASGLVKDPFELAVLMNVMRGPIYTNHLTNVVIPEGKNSNNLIKSTILPDTYDKFNEYFIDLIPDPDNEGHRMRIIKNSRILIKRLTGMISTFIGEQIFMDELPAVRKTLKLKIEMSNHQFQSYIDARKEELKQQRLAQHRGVSMEQSGVMVPPNTGGGSFRSKSRKIQIFAPPLSISEEPTNVQLNHILPEHLIGEQLSQNSPKYDKLLKKLNSTSNQKVLIYSEYKEMGGIKLIAKMLEANGWTNYGDVLSPRHSRRHSRVSKISREPFKTFAMWHGDVNRLTRDEIKRVFNENSNRYGENIRVILITSAGAEGISLKAIRQVHLMEPYWNKSRLMQVIGRGRRRNSHIMLEPNERNIDVYVYIATAPDGIDNLFMAQEHGLTTDQYIDKKAERKEILLGEFRQKMREASFDCDINTPENMKETTVCMQCLKMPNNPQMYNVSIERDLVLPPTCIFARYIKHPIKITDVEKKINNINLNSSVYKYEDTYYIQVPGEKNKYVQINTMN